MEKFSKIRLTTWIVLCLLIGYQSLTAQTKDQLITIRMTNVSLKEVFGAIEKQTTYRFSYRDVVIDNRKDISISYENVPVSVVLNDVLKGRNLEYSIVSDRSIVISDKKTATAVATSGKSQRTVTGTVIDAATNEPIPGANIVEKGTANGSSTDADGKFTLTVKENAVLQISFIGYVMQEIPVGSQTFLNITLQEDAMVLDEVVVVGYGYFTYPAGHSVSIP
ncbi:MAG: carboxypeptidase-like regulatory domain-containing protein [Tannerella sp.]|jgi:hypothetical protein|nr:carboxypeptidase-like regulatory domain-containing protein [Tannerella sp.]